MLTQCCAEASVWGLLDYVCMYMCRGYTRCSEQKGGLWLVRQGKGVQVRPLRMSLGSVKN